MVVSKSVFNALMKQDPKVVEELLHASNMSEVKKSSREEIRRALDKSKETMPVVELSKDGRKRLYEERRNSIQKAIASEKVSGIVFGRDLNLDASLSLNLDTQIKKAERKGIPKSQARAKVVSSVLDFHRIYRNSTDAEKALGTARESFTAPQTIPDRANEVAESFDESLVYRKSQSHFTETINFGKYAKWNDRADEEREERRLEEERISRDERTIEDRELPFFLGR